MHLELKQTFNTYQAVDQALRNLLLAAVPHVYFNSLSNNISRVWKCVRIDNHDLTFGTVRNDYAGRTRHKSNPPELPLESASTNRGSLPSAHPRKPVCLQWLRAHCAFPISSHLLHANRQYRTFRRSMPRMAQNSRHRQNHENIASSVHRGRARPLLITHDFQPSGLPRRKRHSRDRHYAFCASSSRSTSNGTRAGFGTRPSHG